MLTDRPSQNSSPTARAIGISLIAVAALLLAAIVPANSQAANQLARIAASKTASDFALHTAGDATGFHLLVARGRDRYAWRTVATLSEPGLTTDRWIGNACLTASGRRAVVAYAPRSYTNQPELFDRAAFTAIVDLRTGKVTKLAVRSTLAYFSPGCGAGENAIITQSRDSNTRAGRPATRLFTVNTISRRVQRPIELDGQISSPVPTTNGIAAAAGYRLVRITRSGRLRTLARTTSVPYDVAATRAGVVYMQHTGQTARVQQLTLHGRIRELATGPLAGVAIRRGVAGNAWILGDTKAARHHSTAIRTVSVPSTAEISATAQFAVLPPSRPTGATARAAQLPATPTPAADGASPITLSTLNLNTGERHTVTVTPTPNTTGAGAKPSPLNTAGRTPARFRAAGASSTPTDPDATCAVARNDPATLVYQPTPRQVEWAADQAVTGNLKMTRPANWKQSGLSAWTPQGMFPSRALAGGGRVNVQILLGILAQESNLWQASGHVLSGETGNSLIGNYYGRNVYDADTSNDWDINFANADCGIGITQITDGMRKADSERPGETALSPQKQRAVTLDYATNIAAGLQILQDKWNQTRNAGLIHADGDPANIENWIFAIWAYNSGFYPNKGDGSPWGVGYANNPSNPAYPPNRSFFNQNPADAAHPQYWSYPEKVIGWAAYSIATPDGPGFRPAWWISEAARNLAEPPINTFCTAANSCYPGGSYTPTAPEVAGSPAGPCAHKDTAGRYDMRCWWHDRAQYNDCARNQCGNELLRFDSTYAEPADGTHYPPNCGTSGLPAGALIVDDIPSSTPVRRCANRPASSGTFSLNFATDAANRYASKVDFHQIGGGLGAHFWFAHTWAGQPKLKVTGTWQLDRPVNAWSRVLVHMPDHGAQTQQAKYVIGLGDGTTVTRYALQNTQANRWVSLGVLKFSGTPTITLSNDTYDGSGTDDIAWDAIAIQPLPAKPRNFVVALGDSFSSGEGVSDPTDGDDYYRETDVNGELADNAGRNACHRSPLAWSRRATLTDSSSTIGDRADSWDSTMDYQFLACSGARTHNMLPLHSAPTGQQPTNAFGLKGSGQYGELTQIDKGYLDANTTLVTLSIGGNDARFVEILKQCIYGQLPPYTCQNDTLAGDSTPLKTSEPALINGNVKDSVLQILREIRARAPNARIVLMGYPKLFEYSTGTDTTCIPGITTSEAGWIDDQVVVANTALQNAANQATTEGVPTTFSNPVAKFAGKAICGSPAGMHGIVENTTAGDKPKFLGLLPPSSQSFHPTVLGAGLYANSFNDTLRSAGL